MKILIVYTPRSKSTYICNVLAKRFNLEPFGDSLTRSRIKNKNFSEYKVIIDEINSRDNICVKINGNDFIDLSNRCIHHQFKAIDFNSFDKIIFVSRNNILDAVLSYAYMDPANSESWHKKINEDKIGHPYTVDLTKVFYLIRGYRIFDILKSYIETMVDIGKTKVYYEYTNIDGTFQKDFGLTKDDMTIGIEANGLNYRELVTNLDEVSDLVPRVDELFSRAAFRDINDPNSFFWKNTL